MKYMEESGGKMAKIEEDLKDKEEELEALESLNQALVVRELKNNDELQDARKLLFKVCILVDVIMSLLFWNEGQWTNTYVL